MMNDYNGIISTTVQKHLHGFSTLFAITFKRNYFRGGTFYKKASMNGFVNLDYFGSLIERTMRVEQKGKII